MKKSAASKRQVTAAERGHIVQRVLVDGWSCGEAAARFEIGEREVARWVAAYRRRGMASLRHPATAEAAPYRWIAQLRATMARLRAGFGIGVDPVPARCITLPLDSGEHRSSRRRL